MYKVILFFLIATLPQAVILMVEHGAVSMVVSEAVIIAIFFGGAWLIAKLLKQGDIA